MIAQAPNISEDDNHTLGSVLVILGLAGLVPLTLFWLWRGGSGRARLSA